jgi:hypothetical protein
VTLEISFEYEVQTQQWIADLSGIPNTASIHVYGNTQEEAAANVKLAALQAVIWAVEDGEIAELDEIRFVQTPVAA